MGVLQTPNFSLEKTTSSNQCLTLSKLWTIDGPKYTAVVGDKLCIANQYDRLGMTNTFVMGSDDDYFDTWFDFFDLKRDYLQVHRKFMRCMGPVSYAEKHLKGLHLVNVPSFQACMEDLFTDRFPKKKSTFWFEQLCAACCGVKHKSVPGIGSVQWCQVPTPDQVLEAYSAGELDWYFPPNAVAQIVVRVRDYIDYGYFRSYEPSKRDQQLIRRYYGFSFDEFCDWFLDDEEDYDYLCVLLATARKQGFLGRYDVTV